MSAPKEKLLIVGAGLSGLYLATLLEERYEVTILEARERIGGRICSISGHDMGPSWIWSHHKKMLRLLESLDIKIFAQYTKGYALYDTQGSVEKFNPQASAPSFRVDGTLSLLIDTLHKNLKSTKILLHERVLTVKAKEDFIEVSSAHESYKADKVILALPPRLCAKLDFSPALSPQSLATLAQTHTWMGNSAKCLIEFESAFWREKSLSGFAFSNQGPLGEIHDACTKEKAALFGFVSATTPREALHQNVKAQLIRVFEIEEELIGDIHFIDWRAEKFTATSDDAKPLMSHSNYGITLSHADEKILFSATEFAHQEGGYLEGALLRAEEIAKKLLSS